MMRDVTKLVMGRFLKGGRLTRGNSEARGTGAYLFGNLIAEWKDIGETHQGFMIYQLGISAGGHPPSSTTLERLTGLLELVEEQMGHKMPSLSRKDRLFQLDGKYWDGLMTHLGVYRMRGSSKFFGNVYELSAQRHRAGDNNHPTYPKAEPLDV